MGPHGRAPTAERLGDVSRERIGGQAVRLRRAVEHAAGVYFPNRAHNARIAAKKLRYSVELAQQAGVWTPRHLVSDLREVQGTLGDLHDAQVLLDELERLAADADVGGAIARVFAAAPTSGGEIAMLQYALKSEMAERHAEYLTQRERVSAIVAACERFAGVSPKATGRWSAVARPLIAASAVVLPVGLLLGRAPRVRAGDESRIVARPSIAS